MKQLAAFLFLFSVAYADKYDRLEAYYEKGQKLEMHSSTPHQFSLKHDLFYDTLMDDHLSLKGNGRGWRGNYEYSSPNQPYFSIEGSYSASDRMNWDGVAIDSTHISMKDKVKGVPEIHLRDLGSNEANYRLYQEILNSAGNAAFVFNNNKYYRKDLIEHADFIDATHGEVLELNNDWIGGGHVDEEKVGKHFRDNIKKKEGNAVQSIRYNGKEYYRIKDRTEDKEILRGSLGTVSKTLADVNLKAGTNWSFGKALFTPFAGVRFRSVKTVENLLALDERTKGIFDSHPELRVAGIQDTYYGLWGAKCKFAFTPWLDVGINGQINHNILTNASGFVPEQDKGLFSMVGYRASAPISLHMGNRVKYNFEAEPYMEQFDLGRKERNNGIRFSTGISF